MQWGLFEGAEEFTQSENIFCVSGGPLDLKSNLGFVVLACDSAKGETGREREKNPDSLCNS